MIKFGWKGIVLALIVDAVFSAVFNNKVGSLLGLATVIILIVIRQNEKKKNNGRRENIPKRQRVEDYTTGGGSLTSGQVDLLYRKYASVIDEYHITPLPMFMDVLGKSRMQVMSDLNILINNGRFQRARIEYDDNTFVVDEYTKVRPAAGKRTRQIDEYQRDTENGRKAEKTEENLRFEQERKSIVGAVEAVIPYVRDEKMRNVLSGIERSANDIFAKLREDPKLDTGDTRRLLTFYLPKAVECIDYYSGLLQKSDLTDLEEEAKSDLEAALTAMDQSFRKIRNSLSNNDAIDISAEAKAIQQMLKNDGLTDELLRMTPEKEKVKV